MITFLCGEKMTAYYVEKAAGTTPRGPISQGYEQ